MLQSVIRIPGTIFNKEDRLKDLVFSKCPKKNMLLAKIYFDIASQNFTCVVPVLTIFYKSSKRYAITQGGAYNMANMTPRW